MDDLINLRRELHANPELSGAEPQTARRITAVFKALNSQGVPADLVERLSHNQIYVSVRGNSNCMVNYII